MSRHGLVVGNRRLFKTDREADFERITDNPYLPIREGLPTIRPESLRPPRESL